MAEPDIEQAVRQARAAVRLAILCVAVALAVLLIDNSIKRHIVAKAGEARAILEEFNVAAGAVMHGRAEAAERGGTADLAGGDPGDGVVDAPAERPAVDTAEPDVAGAPGAGRAGGVGGPRGNG